MEKLAADKGYNLFMYADCEKNGIRYNKGVPTNPFSPSSPLPHPQTPLQENGQTEEVMSSNTTSPNQSLTTDAATVSAHHLIPSGLPKQHVIVRHSYFWFSV